MIRRIAFRVGIGCMFVGGIVAATGYWIAKRADGEKAPCP